MFRKLADLFSNKKRTEKILGEDIIIIEDAITEIASDLGDVSGNVNLIKKKISIKTLTREWSNIINSLPASLEKYKNTLEEQVSRLFINGNTIEVYVGDLGDIRNDLSKECQEYIQSGLRKAFGDNVVLLFNQDLDFTNLQQLQEPEFLSVNFDLDSDENTEELVLKAELNEINSHLDDIEQQIELEVYSKNMNLIIEILEYYDQAAKINGKLNELLKDTTNLVNEDDVYKKIISYSRYLYQYPRWREIAKNALFKIPTIHIVRYLLTKTGLFKQLAFRKSALENDAGGTLALRYQEAKNRLFFHQKEVIVFCIALNPIDPDEWIDKVKASLGRKRLNNRACIFVTEELTRESVKKAWRLVQLMNDDLNCFPVLFLDKGIIAFLMLELNLDDKQKKGSMLELDLLDKIKKETDKIIFERLDSSISPININVYVVGNEFYGRDAELKRYLGYIEKGQNFHLSGLRRSGKTSTLHQLRKYVAKDIPMGIVDARRKDSDGIELARVLFSSLQDDATLKFPELDWLSYNEKNLSIETIDDFSNEVIRLIKYLPNATKIVLVIDEVEILFPPKYRDYQLHWKDLLDALHSLCSEGEYMEDIVLITIGRVPVLAKSEHYNKKNQQFFGEPHVNFPMIGEDDCKNMIMDLGLMAQINFTNTDVLERIIELTGGHPKFTRSLCEQIAEDNQDKKRPLSVTIDMVNQSVSNALLSSSSRNQEFIDFYRNIDSKQIAMINKIVVAEKGVPKAKLISQKPKQKEIDIDVIQELIGQGLIKETPDHCVYIQMKLLIELIKSFSI